MPSALEYSVCVRVEAACIESPPDAWRDERLSQKSRLESRIEHFNQYNSREVSGRQSGTTVSHYSREWVDITYYD